MQSLVIVAVVAGFLFAGGDARTLATRAKKDGYIKYTTVKGYFLQDDPSTNATTFDYVCVWHARAAIETI